MAIIEIRAMRGPNRWSVYRNKLIVMKLDLNEWEQLYTNSKESFNASLEMVFPYLNSLPLSIGVKNGYNKNGKEDTHLGHIIERVAIELQKKAGIMCGFGQTRATNIKGISHVIFSYVIEKAGLYAGRAAVNLVGSLLKGLNYNVEADLLTLQQLYSSEKLGSSTYAIVKEAERRNIPYTRLNMESLLMLGQGCHQKIICATVTNATSTIADNLASDKDATRKLLSRAYIPVPRGTLISGIDELEMAVLEIGFPLVTKPVNGNHGRGITTRINTIEQARDGFYEAKLISEEIIVEQYINGTDYRFLVINYKLVAVAKRTPAMIVGDNKSTITELIQIVNSSPDRGEGHDKVLTKILIDAATHSILVKNNLTLESVLEIGEILYLKETANLSTGGTARDVTDKVHPENIFLAERIARLVNLDVCGIDIMAKDINIPITLKNGAVLEVNAGPGFRMHLAPVKGMAINVAEPLLSMLYPKNAPARIPIVAVTGTNGKTTVTRLIAHIAQAAGHHTGYTTTDGICIDGMNIHFGDCSGPGSAATVLRDPIVDYAVLECARGGIIRAGLGFDKCSISVVTNISDDHLGLNDIHTIEQLAIVKAVVPQSTLSDGYAILNADDDLVYEMKNILNCNIALFSLEANNPRVLKHCKNGGLAAYVEKNYFIISKGDWKSRVASVDQVPLTFSGKCDFMISNILAAILAASISNIPMETIVTALESFIPSPKMTPGRMNLFQFKNFQLMVDYAHNTGGYVQMKKYLDQDIATHKTGVIGATGDRRDEDIKNIGRYAAQMFDRIILRHDRDNRGRDNEELTQLMTVGIREINPYTSIEVISDEIESIQYAIDHAKIGEFILVSADDIPNTLTYVQQQLDLENTTIELVPVTFNQLQL